MKIWASGQDTFISNFGRPIMKTPVPQWNSKSAIYIQILQAKLKNLHYTIGVGIEHSIQDNGEMKAKHYTVFKPSFSASYQIGHSSSIRLNSLILSNVPDISQLTILPVYLNYQYYSVGNPHLHPYYTFYNRLQYQLSLPTFYMSAAIRHSYLRRPYMTYLRVETRR